jgi:hypothetical protein
MNLDALAPKFRSRKAFIAWCKREFTDDYISLEKADYSEDFKNFCQDGSLRFHSYSWTTLSGLNTELCILNIVDSFSNNTPPRLEYFICARLLNHQLSFYNAARLKRKEALDGSSDDRPFPPAGFPCSLGDMLMISAYIGNRKFVENVLLFCLDLFDLNLVGERGAIPLTQLFTFRLAEKALSMAPRNWLNDNRDWAIDPCEQEPLFAQLWQYWDTQDLNILSPLLVQLLNRHTYQASRNNKDGGKDFGGPIVEQVPWELFFIYRLRQYKGLANPAIEHRLTSPPFDYLPAPAAELSLGQYEKEYIAMTRKFFPEFDQLVEGMKIRDWEMVG